MKISSMNVTPTIQTPVMHKPITGRPLCSIIVYAGGDLARMNSYISFLQVGRLCENYEVFFTSENDLSIEIRSQFKEAGINLITGNSLKSQEQLLEAAAQSSNGRYLLFVKGFTEFEGKILEESIAELDKSVEKISISANKNFVLAERSRYIIAGGLRGLLGGTGPAVPSCVQADNAAVDVIEVDIGKLRSTREHRYKQEYLNKGLMIFDLPVEKTRHFEFIKAYQSNPQIRFESTSFWNLAKSSLEVHKAKTGETHLLHSSGVPITSAEQLCSNFIKIYERIKLEGKFQPINVIALCDGKYMIRDGLHRASAACALGYKTVPVIIKSFDPELSKLVNNLKNAYPEEGRKVLYTPIDHPVFSRWRALRDDTRWRLIKDEFDWKGKKVLDIGSYTGYFSHKIAKLGGIVTGIEIDNKRLEQSIMINKLLESNVEFLKANFFEYLKCRKFDCVVFFSVLHWVLKEKGMSGFREALNILSSAAPVMFLDMGQDHEEKVRQKEWNHGVTISKDTIPDLVISNSKYKSCKHLGTGDTGRDVFKFTIFDEGADEHIEGIKNVVKFNTNETKLFYEYEGSLATEPIVEFLEKNSKKCCGKLVDVGCGSKPYINYFRHVSQYIGVDRAGSKADIIADAKSIPIESNSVDAVLCNQLIEHDAEPGRIIAEIYRILKKDGILLLSAPQMGRLHGEPHDYYRFTKWGLKHLLEQNGLTVEIIEPHGGIFRAIGSHLNFFIIEHFGERKNLKSILRHKIIPFTNFIFSQLDNLIKWEKDTLGYNVVARKRGC